MACGFCAATPVSPCPMCEVNLTMTPRPMRKGPKKAPGIARSVTPPVVSQARVDNWANAWRQTVPQVRSATDAAAWDATRPTVAQWTARNAIPTQKTTPPPIVAQRPAQSARVAVLSVCCNDCEEVFPASRSIPAGMAKLANGILVCDRCAGKRAAVVRPTPHGILIDWKAAAAFTMAMLRKPTQIEGTCRGAETLAPVSRGDWAGLGRAVDAGILSHAQAVELAASWKGVSA